MMRRGSHISRYQSIETIQSERSGNERLFRSLGDLKDNQCYYHE